MPVYHFTLHAYRTWGPDKPQGFVKRDKGVQKPDPHLADAYNRAAKQPPVEFTPALMAVLVWGAHDACQRRGWRLHAAGTDPTHVHMVVSWRRFVHYDAVMGKLKNVLSYLLGKFSQLRERRWFVRDGSHRRVERRSHLDYLIDEYLPSHRGPFWKEGWPVPPCPEGL